MALQFFITLTLISTISHAFKSEMINKNDPEELAEKLEGSNLTYCSIIQNNPNNEKDNYISIDCKVMKKTNERREDGKEREVIIMKEGFQGKRKLMYIEK